MRTYRPQGQLKSEQEKLRRIYGTPNEEGVGYIDRVKMPFPLVIAWQPDTKVTMIRLHKKVTNQYLKSFEQILEHYGIDEIERLRINWFGGAFYYRKMMGSATRLSSHSWGVAIDLDPARNTLYESKKTARFAKPAYEKMHEIFEANGIMCLGRKFDFDWMHFQPTAIY